MGIHHLHLSSSKKRAQDYFNDRTGPLLFVRFTHDQAFFLDIKSHTDKNVWSDRDMIRIIQRNWPQSIAHKEIPGVTMHPELDDEQIGQLRNKGYLFGINVDGKAYMLLGHGQSTSGLNMMAMRLTNQVWDWVGDNEYLIATDLPAFERGLQASLHL